MSLSLGRSSSGPITTERYNADIDKLFGAFEGLEEQTKTLGGLKMTPKTDGTVMSVTNAAGTVIFKIDTTKGVYIGEPVD